MHNNHKHSTLTKMILLTLLVFSILTGFKYPSAFGIGENYPELCEIDPDLEKELI